MIVIPMAGLSSRFFEAGYKEPKYKLVANGKSLFDHSVLSFKHYFSDTPFIFIIRDVFNTLEFVQERCVELGLKKYEIITLEEETKGQAETVYLGVKHLALNTPITIFNIDTFRQNYRIPSIVNSCDGYLEVFEGSGSNWSYVKPKSNDSNIVVETAEKRAISNLCSTGLYYFKKVNDFISDYEDALSTPKSEWAQNELYIAPLYNHLIKNKKTIKYELIKKSQVVFCGTPKEYLQFQEITKKQKNK